MRSLRSILAICVGLVLVATQLICFGALFEEAVRFAESRGEIHDLVQDIGPANPLFGQAIVFHAGVAFLVFLGVLRATRRRTQSALGWGRTIWEFMVVLALAGLPSICVFLVGAFALFSIVLRYVGGAGATSWIWATYVLTWAPFVLIAWQRGKRL